MQVRDIFVQREIRLAALPAEIAQPRSRQTLKAVSVTVHMAIRRGCEANSVTTLNTA